MRSSYIAHNYGDVIVKHVLENKPSLCVELGILDGYSTIHIARGLMLNCEGILDAYDLFEDYAYKHSSLDYVRKVVEDNGVDDYVNLYKGDAYKVHEKYRDGTIELLHIDISNTGKILRDLIELWDPKMRQGGIILFEGGSEERDNVEWMKKYDMPPIKKELETNHIIQNNYYYKTYQQFPSMTVLVKNVLYGDGC